MRRRLHRCSAGLIAAALLAFAPTVAATHVRPSASAGLIAFTGVDSAGKSQIFEVRADGTGRRQITRNGESNSPAWSPDGTRLAWVHATVANRVVLVAASADGSHQRVIAAASKGDAWDSRPAWSPAGREIALGVGFKLCVINLRGGDRCIVKSRDLIRAPAWSPDGRAISYWEVGFDEGVPPTLHIVPSQGGKSVEIMSFSWALSWSPDGRRMFFLCGSPERSQLCRADERGKNIERFQLPKAPLYGAGSGPFPSPDRTWFAVILGGDVWTIQTATLNSTKLTARHMDSQVAWSPDGSELIVVRTQEGIDGLSSLYRVGAHGGRLVAITKGPKDRDPTWQPAPA